MSGVWGEETVCTRPYDVGPYGTSAYGRCAIIGNAVWQADIPCVVALPGDVSALQKRNARQREKMKARAHV